MKILLYFLRWQIAGLTLYTWTVPLWGNWIGTIAGNLIGAFIFFYIDRYLTNKSGKI